MFCLLSVLETPELWSPSPPVCKLTKPPLMRLYDTVYVHRPLFGKFAALIILLQQLSAILPFLPFVT